MDWKQFVISMTCIVAPCITLIACLYMIFKDDVGGR